MGNNITAYYDNRYEKMDNEQFIDTYSGEIVTRLEVEEHIRANVVEVLCNTNENLEILHLPPIVMKTNGRRSSDAEINVKNKYVFCKTFRVVWREIMNGKTATGQPLSVYARAIITTLTPFIAFPSNMVKIDSKIPNHEQLIGLCGMSRGSYFKAMNELEDNEILLRVKEAHGATAIYFNPFLTIAGYKADEETLNLFRDSRYVAGCPLFE